MDASTGSLVVQAVKLVYEKWTKSRAEALRLSDGAKAVLEEMQSDPTNNGVFLHTAALGDVLYKMVCLYQTDIRIETTRRVIVEMEAKGLLTIERRPTKGDSVTLSHLGWILNPDTGKVDKTG